MRLLTEVYHDTFGYFLWGALPISVFSVFFTRKIARWKLIDFLPMFFAPLIWTFMTVSVNDLKSLVNLVVERFILGVLVGLLFLPAAFREKKMPGTKFRFLLVSTIIVTIVVQLLFPPLPE